jgi:hypothetical protein
MTDAAAVSADWKPPDRANATLLAIVVALAIVDSIVLWCWPESAPGVSGIAYHSFVVVQPVLFGVWTALGPGSIVSRLPMAVACLVLLWVVPSGIPDNSEDFTKFYFLIASLAGLAVYLATTILFLIFRRFTRFRLLSAAGKASPPVRHLRFSTRYILLLMTILAVDLGMAFNLKFQAEPPRGNNFFGPGLFIWILFMGAALLTAMILPTLVIPLSILHGQPSRRAIGWSLVLWGVVMVSLEIIVFDGNFSLETLVNQLMGQFVAVVTATLIAVLLRYCAGVRLVRSPATS